VPDTALDSPPAPTQETILVVDDHPEARRLLGLLLACEQHRILYAADGPTALAIAEAEADLSLIILDIMMPGMDGLEVCRRIRAAQRERHVPIILATALTEEEQLAEGLAAGADDYVTKPIRHTELLARVRAALRLRQAHEQLADAKELAAIAAMQVTLAHEINNPLTIALGNLELALRGLGDVNGQLHARLQAAFDACARIRRIVQQLAELKTVATTTYLGPIRMLDLGHPPTE